MRYLATILFLLFALPANAQTLFFSEYLEGASNDKALELYNATDAAIDLTGYTIELYSNGGTDVSTTVDLTGSVDAGAAFVILHPQAALADVTADMTGSLYFNGNDAVVLKDDAGTVLDVLGQVGDDTDWGGETILRRKATACTPKTEPTAAFDAAVSYDQLAFSEIGDLGTHTADCSGEGPAITAIGEARTQMDATVTIEGVIASNDFGYGSGEFYVEDATGGIYVYGSGVGGEQDETVSFDAGQRIRITGTIGAYNGQTQIALDSHEMLGEGTLPAPTAITTADVTAESEYQGQRVMLSGVTLAETSEWPTEAMTSGGGMNTYFVTSTDDTVTVRIDRGQSFYDGSERPTGVVNLTGTLGRYNDTPQIMPFFEGDIQGAVAIADARTQVDASVMIEGVIASTDYGYGDANFYVQDETGGILVYGNGVGGEQDETVSFAAGERIRINGTISVYRGQTQITIDSYEMLGEDTLPEPVDVTAAEVTAESELQGQRVRLSGVTLAETSEWPTDAMTSGGGMNTYFVTSTDDTVTVRIDRGQSFFDGSTRPTGTVDLIGTLGRYNDSPQIMPFFEGDIQASTATEDELVTDELLSLTAPSPNPSMGQAQIGIELQRPGQVAVELYDMLGRRVWTRPAAPMSAGSGHQLQIGSTDLPAGVYLYRVTVETGAGAEVKTGSMTLVR